MPKKMVLADASKLNVINIDANGKVIEDLSKVKLWEVAPELNAFVAKVLIDGRR